MVKLLNCLIVEWANRLFVNRYSYIRKALFIILCPNLEFRDSSEFPVPNSKQPCLDTPL